MKFLSKSNGTKSHTILIFLGPSILLFGHSIMIGLIPILLLSDLDKLVIGDCYFRNDEQLSTTRYIANRVISGLQKFSAINEHRQIVDLAFKNE